MSANSKPGAARTFLPARSRGIWPMRTPQLRNTWRPVVIGRKSRCCLPISSKSSASRASASGVRTAQETNSYLRRPLKPQAPRPLETDEYASGNAGRISPSVAAQELPKRPHLILLEILRASPSEGILDGFFNGIDVKQTLQPRVPRLAVASLSANRRAAPIGSIGGRRAVIVPAVRALPRPSRMGSR
jgi:hypothetical protein